MHKIKVSIAVSVWLLGGASLIADEDLGLIQVESSTIDDKFQAKKDEVSVVTSISGKKVDESKAENIQRVLQSIPGITTEIQGGDSLKIHIRGVENQVFMGEKPGVAVVIDGVPVFERTGRVNIDMDNIESIKVIKGGASYLFGDDALSGAVIITTKKGASNPGGKFEVERGSYGYEKYLARYGVSEEKYNAYLQVSQRKKDGYHEDSDYESNYVNGKVQYYIDDTSDVSGGFEYSKRDKNSHGTVTGVTEASVNPRSVWTEGNDRVSDYAAMYNVELLKLFSTYSKDFESGENLLVNLYQYGDNTEYYSGYAYYDGMHNPVTNPLFKPNFNEYDQVQRGLKSEFRGNIDKSAYMLGADLRDNNYKNKTSYGMDWAAKRGPKFTDYTQGEITANDETHENVYALYGEFKYPLSPTWSATTNLRYDKIKHDYTDNLSSLDINKDFDQYSYRVGLNNQINEEMTFYTAYSTGFRAPSIEQLFSGNINPDGSVLSNPNLKSEEAQSYDIGVRGTAHFLNHKSIYELGLFRVERNNYIMSSAGQYATVDRGQTSQYQNIGGMQSQGLELALGAELNEKIAYNIAYTYTDAKFTKYDNYNLLLGNPYGVYTLESLNLKNNKIPRVSKHHLNLSFDHKMTHNLTLSPEVDAISSYYADELNRHKIPGHALFNFVTEYKTKFNNNDLSLFARLDNALDKTYYTTARAYRDSDGDGDYDAEDISLSVNEGRTINVGMSLKF